MRHAAAYLPARYIKRFIDEGRLHLVPDTPRFPYPVWSIWRDDLDEDIRATAETALVAIRSQIESEQSDVIAELAGISEGGTVQVLGNKYEDFK